MAGGATPVRAGTRSRGTPLACIGRVPRVPIPIHVMPLHPQQRAKLDPSDDALFYRAPRFVTHVDPAFIARLTDLYRRLLRPGMRVLDLMSSWVSHLPPEMRFAHVEGHGMNAAEVVQHPGNPRRFFGLGEGSDPFHAVFAHRASFRAPAVR